MRNSSRRAALAVAWGLLALSSGRAQERLPIESGVVESVRTRLAQVDITVTGPREQVDRLTVKDFELQIGSRRIEEFKIDRFCGDQDSTGNANDKVAEPATGDTELRVRAASAPATYLFYFDQPYLTLAGRQEALDLARELIPEVVRNGSRAMIVSNARALEVVAPFTEDPQALIAALERLEKDRKQWDPWAEEEETRVASVVDALNRRQNISAATNIARILQREERARADRDLRRLGATLWHLAPADSPKAVVYFADTIRANAGAHYLSFFGSRQQKEQIDLVRMHIDNANAPLAFDRVVNDAVALGVRFYNIQPSGLGNLIDRRLVGMSGQELAGAVSAPASVRSQDTRNMLESLAAETGGEAFVNGATAARVARQIRGDFECLFVASFDPSEIAEDKPLRLKVSLRVSTLRAEARGRFILQSARSEETARVLSEFLLAETGDAAGVRTSLVPTGFDGERFTALLQIRIPPNALHLAKWDVGASVVSRERVREEVSGRIEISAPGRYVVLESVLTLATNAFEIVSVARESFTGLVLSDRLRVEWTRTPQGLGVAGPIHLLQPAAGGFSRDGRSRGSGSLALGIDEPADPNRPIAFVGLVCRGRRDTKIVVVDRALSGTRAIEFEPLRVELIGPPCALVRDIFPAGSLIPGRYAYRLAVRSEKDGSPRVETIREFHAAGSPVAAPEPGEARGH